MRNWAKPLIEILAGIPTVVYGFFAALPWRRWSAMRVPHRSRCRLRNPRSPLVS